MLQFIEQKYPEIYEEIREKKEISDELDGKISKALTEFGEIFQSELG